MIHEKTQSGINVVTIQVLFRSLVFVLHVDAEVVPTARNGRGPNSKMQVEHLSGFTVENRGFMQC